MPQHPLPAADPGLPISRKQVEAQIDLLIDLLDTLDGDSDLEPDADLENDPDAEPSLGWPDSPYHPTQTGGDFCGNANHGHNLQQKDPDHMPKAIPINTTEYDRPSVSQLLHTRRKLNDLKRGHLPCRIVDELGETASGLEDEIIATPARDWPEFGAKVRLLFDETFDANDEDRLGRSRASLREDVERLEAANG